MGRGHCGKSGIMSVDDLPSSNTQMSVHDQSYRPKLRSHHGPVEIERKFLVANDEWRRSAIRSVSICDGLIAASENRKARVRISGGLATIDARSAVTIWRRNPCREALCQSLCAYPFRIALAEQRTATSPTKPSRLLYWATSIVSVLI